MEYFYDESCSKTYLFFVFNKRPMKIYNLKERSWDKSKSFPINENKNSEITAIKFLTAKDSLNNTKKYVIYAQILCAYITIADIDSSSVVKKVYLPGKHHFDLLLWNCLDAKALRPKTYLLVSSKKSNDESLEGSVNILSFNEDLSLVLEKTLEKPIYPVCFLKTNVGWEKEILVAFYGPGISQSDIAIYEKVFIVLKKK